jgi:hypothetical protein
MMSKMNFLIVYKTQYKKIRLGSKNDGGYVLADGMDYDLLLSCGIANDISFEEEFLKKYNVKCVAFDGTIESLPHCNDSIEFIKKNITNSETDTTTNLINWIENNDNIFLKMDIETNEYQWLEKIEEIHLLKFKQILIEFHFPFTDERDDIFEQLSFPISVSRKINCFDKLARTHYLIHLHGNNCCGTMNYCGIVVPNVFECTYIRKDLCKHIEYNEIAIPDKDLDKPNVTGDDIYLTGYPYTSHIKNYITILGSCRQQSLYCNYSVSSIQQAISYPHYTKEILEMIRFCKNGHLTPDETLFTFRTPILTKTPLYFNHNIKNDFENSDIFVIEIASKIAYEYKGIYVHHIATDTKYNLPIKNEIVIRTQTKNEIEEDILEIIKLLLGKKIIIVGHLVTYEKGERYNLVLWLEEICKKYNILFIDPIKEIKKRQYDIEKIFLNEPTLAHYNDYGNALIKGVYSDFINKLNFL